MPKAPATTTKFDLKLAGILAASAAVCDPNVLARASERNGALRFDGGTAGIE